MVPSKREDGVGFVKPWKFGIKAQISKMPASGETPAGFVDQFDW